MHFTVIREHREFFRKHHWIECDEMISKLELNRFSETIPWVLNMRAEPGILSTSATEASDSMDFFLGHDIWRGSPILKKLILNRSLAEIASELIEEKPLRFGYDTLFPAVSIKPENSFYESFLQTNPTLKEMSAVQGVLCGAMLCLSGNREAIIEEKPKTTTLFSRTKGNAVFFSPDWPLPLSEIYQNPGFVYLLIVYVKANAVYLAQQGDPHLHHFKRLGYNFGDRLREPFHPIVYS